MGNPGRPRQVSGPGVFGAGDHGYDRHMNDAAFWRELGQQLRVDSIRASDAAGSGHPTSSMSAADLIAVLLANHLHYDFGQPEDPRNDHLIFSKGHASPLYYGFFKAAGAITDEELLTLPQAREPLRGPPHPGVALGGRGDRVARPGPADRRRRSRSPASASKNCLIASGCFAVTARWRRGRSGRRSSRRLTTGSTTSSAIIDMNRLGQRGQTDARLGPRRVRRTRSRLRLARDRDRRPRRRGDRRRVRGGIAASKAARPSSWPGRRRARASA